MPGSGVTGGRPDLSRRQRVHVIGAGGTGMSAIATVLLQMGHRVTGSDASASKALTRLADMGAQVHVGHDPAWVAGAELVVRSTAIPADNPEVVEAERTGLRVWRRAEVLAAICAMKRTVAVAGTHGKTTTASLLALILTATGRHPSVIVGGEVAGLPLGAAWEPGGEWMVVEADESDGTFLKLPADIAIVTNVDAEHLDHFKTFAAVQEAFTDFVGNVPFYGFAVMCTDHPIVQRLVGRITDRRIITYGENPQADVRLAELDHHDGRSKFAVLFRDREGQTVHTIDNLTLPMPGRHNALNATAAVAVAHELKIPDDTIRKALAKFGGVKRRFTKAGEWNGVTIIDDYGHHPVEIAAVLKAARDVSKGQVIAVVQPHRYTRLKTLFEPFSTCFNDADAVIVADVYPAGEAPIEGADRDHLVEALRLRGHRQVIALDGPSSLAGIVKGLAKPGDYVVLLGAGSITQWAYALPEQLKALK